MIVTSWHINPLHLLLCLCVVFYSSFVYTCVCIFLHIQSPLRECRSIRSGASGLPYYCAPLVCVSAVMELLAVWRHNKPQPKNSSVKGRWGKVVCDHRPASSCFGKHPTRLEKTSGRTGSLQSTWCIPKIQGAAVPAKKQTNKQTVASEQGGLLSGVAA